MPVSDAFTLRPLVQGVSPLQIGVIVLTKANQRRLPKSELGDEFRYSLNLAFPWIKHFKALSSAHDIDLDILSSDTYVQVSKSCITYNTQIIRTSFQ